MPQKSIGTQRELEGRMRKTLEIMLILTIICFSSPAFSEGWPSERGGPEGRASVKYEGTNEIREWQFTYNSGKRYEAGASVWASPAIAVISNRPMAFIGGYGRTMVAMDLIDKRALWKRIANGIIVSAPAVGKVKGNDIVFWGTSDRTVYACEALSGKLLWTRELISPLNTLGEVTISSPYLADEKLYITGFAYNRTLAQNGQEADLFCLNQRTGEVIWKIRISGGYVSSPVGFSHKGKRFIAVSSRRGLLLCFDVSGKKPEKSWQYQMPHEVLGSPVIMEDPENPLVYLGSKYGNLIAIDALSGKEVWQRMAGNWIDNSACVGEVEDKKIVFAGSYDYYLYAFDAVSGEQLWKKPLGGEIYSAPCFFKLNGKPVVVAAALDNHLSVLDAKNGEILTSFFTGNPIWDKVNKGETIWGSPAALEAGENTAVVFGSYSDRVLVIPQVKDSSLRAMARSSDSLWQSILAVFLIFTGVILPAVIFWPEKELSE